MNLPDGDHVMRYVPWSRLITDETGNILGIFPHAFQLRGGETYLSVNWIEYFEGDSERRKCASVLAFRRTLQVGPKSAFGIGNVGEVKKVCSDSGAKARIIHRKRKDNEAHSAIYGIPPDDLNLLQSLAQDVFIEVVRNADVPAEVRPGS